MAAERGEIPNTLTFLIPRGGPSGTSTFFWNQSLTGQHLAKCRLLLRRTLDMKLVIDFIRLDVADSTIGCCGFHNVEIKPGELVSLRGSPSTYSIEWSSVRLNSGIISSTHSGGTRLVLLESFWIVSWVIKLVILLESLWINVMLVIILVCIVLLQSIDMILVLLE